MTERPDKSPMQFKNEFTNNTGKKKYCKTPEVHRNDVTSLAFLMGKSELMSSHSKCSKSSKIKFKKKNKIDERLNN